MKRLLFNLLFFFLFSLRLFGSGFRGFSLVRGIRFLGLFIRRRLLYKEPFLWLSIRKVAIVFLSVVIDAEICMARKGSNTRASR